MNAEEHFTNSAKHFVGRYRDAIKEKAYVSTESIVIASLFKNENFKKARSHFHSDHAFLTAFSNTLLKMKSFSLMIKIQKVSSVNEQLESDINSKFHPVSVCPQIKDTIKMFSTSLISDDIEKITEMLEVILNRHLEEMS